MPKLTKLLVVFCLFLSTNLLFGQLDSLHYLPPLKQVSNNAAIKEQTIYLSTPNTTPFNVEVYRGSSNTPYRTITGLAKGSPKRLDNTNGLGNGDNNITLVINSNTGKVLTNGGLRFVSSNGQKFYVNYRGRSSAQAGSLTCKGTKALGTDFRWGGIPNRANNANLSTSLGMMASEDGTVVTVSGYDPNCKFRVGGSRGGITDNTLTINLNAGETFVIEAAKNETTANIDGWLGAKITSTKPIAIANGGLNVGINSNSQGRDVGIDQPVATNFLGREYVFVRGNGGNSSEFPIIVGTKSGTEIFVGNSSTPIATINDGEYFEIPGSNYSGTSAGANMYVRTSQNVYAFQCLTGQKNRIQTIGMNFIAPVNCLLPSVLNEVPEINRIAGVNSKESAITIIAATTTPDANIQIKQNGATFPLPASKAIAGTSTWKTYYINGLKGEVEVISTGPIAVGTFMALGNNAGLAGYFSGFDTVPEVNLVITGGGCFPGSDIQEVTAGFDAYQWYKDGVAIPNATNAKYEPDNTGSYYVEVTKGPCTYASNVVDYYNCDPDIILTKTVDVTNVTDDDIVTYTIKVESVGVNPVTNLVITEAFPSALEFVSSQQDIGTYNAPNWTIGTMNPGEIRTLTIKARVPKKPPSGNVSNTVTNNQDQVDSNRSQDSPTAVITIQPKKVDLKILKTVDNATPKKGELVIFNLTLTNTGATKASGVRVKDLLPNGLTYNLANSVIPPNTSYNAATGIWDLSQLTLSANQTVSIKIAANVVTTGVITMNVTEIFSGEQFDEDSNENSNN